MGAEELYTLTTGDINLEKRIIYVKHNPVINHTTKNKKSSISFFTVEARYVFKTFLEEFKDRNDKKILFPKRTMERAFKESQIIVKDLCNAFSQE